jgi:hypothetical protein
MNRPIILDAEDSFGPAFPKPDSCPRCRSRNFIDIVYGFPADETLAQAIAGELALGGCTPGEASWHCRDCKQDWPKWRQWPTQEEYLAFRLRVEQHRKRPDVFLRTRADQLRTWCAERIERHIRIPLLLRFGGVTLHRKLRLQNGSFQYMVRFGDAIVRVRPDDSAPAHLHALCLKAQSSAAISRRYEAAALRFVERQSG